MGDSVLEAAAQNEPLHKTCLWDLHRTHGGKMVAFAGYDMPVQYDGMGVLKEHLHTRESVGLFDVSHMGQAILHSPTMDPATALEKLVPSDIIGLDIGQQRYTVLLNDNGGIVDDLMVTRWDAHTLFLVVNAACKHKDFKYIHDKIGAITRLEYLSDRALLALQGPKAEQVASTFFSGILDLTFMQTMKSEYQGHEVYISRSGYTGEDGFEISLPSSIAVTFAKEVLQEQEVKLIGLGARDSLRLEAGLCLYGHDIDDHSTPVMAHLKWTIAKRRREEANFPGARRILSELANGPKRLRVGVMPEGRAPAREGTEIVDMSGAKIGVITSGGFGPTVNGPVAMGYVDAAHSKTGTPVQLMVRGKALSASIVDMPVVPHSYYRG